MRLTDEEENVLDLHKSYNDKDVLVISITEDYTSAVTLNKAQTQRLVDNLTRLLEEHKTKKP